MGYHTEFEGRIEVVPPLNEKEIEYINQFANTRRMHRENGPYFVGGTGMMGQGHDSDIFDHNHPDPSQPGLWCKWEASEDGKFIEWNYAEKFYDADIWMEYIINHFIGKDPIAKRVNDHFAFLQGHACNGTIEANGEEASDIWCIVVKDGVVSRQNANISYD